MPAVTLAAERSATTHRRHRGVFFAMDSLIAAAARALIAGDILGALKRVALRHDPPALALRGIAMAQLGEHARARELLRRAVRRFGAHEELARARCVVADAEVAMAMRDLGASPRTLAVAVATLEAHGDHPNAMQGKLIAVRGLLLLGRLAAAKIALEKLDTRGFAPSLVAIAELTAAELALRSLSIERARLALTRAQVAADRAAVPVLQGEVSEALAAFDRPAARRIFAEGEQTLCLSEVAELLASDDALVVDACRHALVYKAEWRVLARRPVLFALLRILAEAWPGDADRVALIEHAFRNQHPDESHRARLRVEISRLRTLITPLAQIEATQRGFLLIPRGVGPVVLLAPPIDGDEASLIALLSDGAAWSTSALALALGSSQRTVQRALVELEAAGSVRSIGRARSQRWLSPPLTGFTTVLLLPVTLPIA